MPFNVKKSGKGYKVFSPSGAKSKKPMSKEKARKQQSAIYANWKGESFEQRLNKVLLDGIVVECMDDDEIKQRAAAFRQSIAKGRLTPEQVKQNVLGWIKAEPPVITKEQAVELIRLVNENRQFHDRGELRTAKADAPGQSVGHILTPNGTRVPLADVNGILHIKKGDKWIKIPQSQIDKLESGEVRGYKIIRDA